MTPRHVEKWSHILTLMTAVVVIDNNIHKAEVETFLRGADLLANKLSVKTDMTRSALGNWFQIKHQEITEHMQNDFLDRFILEHILALQDFDEKELLLNCLYEIAFADKEFHPNETIILKLSAAYFKVPMPQFKNLSEPSLTHSA